MGRRTNGRAIFLMADNGEYGEHLVCGGIVHWNQGRGPCPHARRLFKCKMDHWFVVEGVRGE